jgi:hypothetical protein
MGLIARGNSAIEVVGAARKGLRMEGALIRREEAETATPVPAPFFPQKVTNTASTTSVGTQQ